MGLRVNNAEAETTPPATTPPGTEPPATTPPAAVEVKRDPAEILYNNDPSKTETPPADAPGDVKPEADAAAKEVTDPEKKLTTDVDQEVSKEEKVDKPSDKTSEDIKLAMPEDSKLDSDHVEKTALFAKEQGFSNKQAQAVLNRENEAVASFVVKQQQETDNISASWRKDSLGDPIIGGDNIKEFSELSRRGTEYCFGEDGPIVDAIIASGIGNHPSFIKGMSKIGRMIGDDRFIDPGLQPENKQPKTRAQLIYPNQK